MSISHTRRLREDDPGRRVRPGWLEVGVVGVAYAALLLVGIATIWAVPREESVTRGIVELAVSGLAGIGGFAAAASVRIRRLDVFGVRAVAPKWLAVGAAAGLGVYLLNIAVAVVVTQFADASNPQADYRAASAGGLIALMVTVLAGAIVTPIGEELVFRGVLANALGRYSAWVSVLVSAAAFALVHGINVILPLAFVVGVVAAILFRVTGSIWPGVVMHGVNNLASIGVSAALAAVVG